MKAKINLVTLTDCKEFIEAVQNVTGNITLESGNGFCVNAKSFLGAMAATEWDDLWVNSDTDIYRLIDKWIIN
jgi:hypothetical protein